MKRKPLSKMKIILCLTLFIAASCLGAGMLWGFGASAREEQKPERIIRPVKIVHLSEETFDEARSFPGLVNAARETRLAFRVSGPLVALDIRIGQRVNAGDVIARIDPRDFEINATRLSAALGEARANLKAMKRGARAEDVAGLEAELNAARARQANVRKDFERQENLLANQAVSQARYDGAKTAFDMAKANVEVLIQKLKKAKRGARSEDVEAAEARIRRLAADVKAAEHALEDTTLKAPFSGYASRQYVENYENVRAGEPIVSFLDVSNVEVHTAIPEDVIVRRSSLSDIYCMLDAHPGQRFEATLKEIGRKTDSANQSYPLTVILHIPVDLIVEPGMAATLHVSLKSPVEPHNGFALPASAVFSDAEGQTCVWVVEAETMTVVKTRVDAGALDGDAIRIRSGLDVGDRVVTAGAGFLRDGQQIRLLRQNREDRS